MPNIHIFVQHRDLDTVFLSQDRLQFLNNVVCFFFLFRRKTSDYTICVNEREKEKSENIQDSYVWCHGTWIGLEFIFRHKKSMTLHTKFKEYSNHCIQLMVWWTDCLKCYCCGGGCCYCCNCCCFFCCNWWWRQNWRSLIRLLNLTIPKQYAN